MKIFNFNKSNYSNYICNRTSRQNLEKMPYGEIFLSKYNLYPHLNFNNKKAAGRKNKNTKIILQILSYSDGEKDLVDIANKIKTRNRIN